MSGTNLRSTSAGAEAWTQNIAPVRATAAGIEAWTQGAGNIRCSIAGVEVWASTLLLGPPPSSRIMWME